MVHSFVVGPCRIATLPAHITTHTRTHANTQQTFRLFSHISPFVGRSSNPPIFISATAPPTEITLGERQTTKNIETTRKDGVF